MTDTPDKNGRVTSNGFTYYVTASCNRPFCHVCRKTVERVVAVERLQGNPLHMCEACLNERLSGFGELDQKNDKA